jgi:hypothetical protein
MEASFSLSQNGVWHSGGEERRWVTGLGRRSEEAARCFILGWRRRLKAIGAAAACLVWLEEEGEDRWWAGPKDGSARLCGPMATRPTQRKIQRNKIGPLGMVGRKQRNEYGRLKIGFRILRMDLGSKQKEFKLLESNFWIKIKPIFRDFWIKIILKLYLKFKSSGF